MSLGNLEVLKQHQQTLLLAEAAALLHDVGKCADEHIVNQASDKPQGYSYRYKTAQSHRLLPTLADVNLVGETVSVKDLIEQAMPRSIRDTSKPWLLRVLGKCHAIAHVEKELSDNDLATKQPKDDTRLSTAYGLEGGAVKGLTALLDGLPFHALTNRPVFASQVKQAFDNALGDTRRPVNEVTLADWSDVVASLYKAALAGSLLGIKPDPDQLRWRILRVNFDVLGLYAKAIKIADLLGYQNVVEEACEKVKKLVEEEYPLGNEVYRDTTGIYFTFPDLGLPSELEQEIRRRVEQVDPELAPRILVEPPQGSTATEQLKRILAKAREKAVQALAQPFDSQNLSACWQQLWANLPLDKKWEVCPVCRLRPKEEHDEACKHCTNRRGSRIADWQANPHRTIWIDELADHNDRIALIVGKFGSDDWLSGDLVQTMLVNAVANAPDRCVPKNPSPARLRRVWETCQRFWTETVEHILAKFEYGKGTKNAPLRCIRLLLIPDKKTDWKENVPYDGTLNGKAISLLWRESAKHFVTISNLQWTGEIKAGQGVTVDDPNDPTRKITFIIQGVMPAMNNMSTYAPYLPLLASPDQFLAIVPAWEAMDVVYQIRCEYQEQFGKVQNRLPLLLGLVFFQRKTPLMPVMDTARRMLDQVKLGEQTWRIRDGVANGQVQFENGITWTVPTKMGDGTTEDVWYPYFFFEGDPGTRSRRFQLDGCWLVHVNDLHAGDAVRVTPSRFAYLYLEHTAQRFRFDPNRDVMLLDELPRLVKIWEDICDAPDMSDTKLQAIGALFESKWQLWRLGQRDGDVEARRKTFRDLVETTFKRDRVKISPDEALNGNFQRCLDLYLHILKRRVKEEKHE